MNFRLVPKSVTLNDEMALILRYFTERGSFRGALLKVVEDISTYLNFLRQKCSQKHLGFTFLAIYYLR